MHDESLLYAKLFILLCWISNECQMNLYMNNFQGCWTLTNVKWTYCWVESLRNVKWTLIWTIIWTVESLSVKNSLNCWISNECQRNLNVKNNSDCSVSNECHININDHSDWWISNECRMNLVVSYYPDCWISKKCQINLNVNNDLELWPRLANVLVWSCNENGMNV